jgi:hypothetical protein
MGYFGPEYNPGPGWLINDPVRLVKNEPEYIPYILIVTSQNLTEGLFRQTDFLPCDVK